MLAHTIFFTLIDNSRDARQCLVAACRQYLSGHPGTVFFAAGTRAEEFQWSVSDLDFDVALYLVFTDKEAQDTYQDSPRHQQFLDENEANWKALRAFDAYVE
jgi:hypothetical protein